MVFHAGSGLVRLCHDAEHCFDVRLDFQPASAGIPERAGYGVDRIRGVYREEIFGLHKPLGPQQDIGLRVEGTFELNRVSLIDTLNAR